MSAGRDDAGGGTSLANGTPGAQVRPHSELAQMRHRQPEAAPSSLPTNSYLIREDAARLLGVTVRALEAWAARGNGPRYRKHGRRVVYSLADLHAWSDQQVRTSTSGGPQ